MGHEGEGTSGFTGLAGEGERAHGPETKVSTARSLGPVAQGPSSLLPLCVTSPLGGEVGPDLSPTTRPDAVLDAREPPLAVGPPRAASQRPSPPLRPGPGAWSEPSRLDRVEPPSEPDQRALLPQPQDVRRRLPLQPREPQTRLRRVEQKRHPVLEPVPPAPHPRPALALTPPRARRPNDGLAGMESSPRPPSYFSTS